MLFFLRILVLTLAFVVSLTYANAGEEQTAQLRKKARQQATAAPEVAFVSPIDKAKQIVPVQGLYSVTLTCKKDGTRSSSVQTGFNLAEILKSLFVNKSETISFLLTIHSDDPQMNSDGTAKLPQSILAAVPIYSVQKETVIDGFDSCNRTFLIDGSKKLYVTPTVAMSDKYEAGTIFRAVTALAEIATPFSTLIGIPIPAGQGLPGFNNEFQKLKTPADNLLKILDTSAVRTTPFRLFVATRVITVKGVGTIQIDVHPIDSIVAEFAAQPDLLNDFNARLKVVLPKPTPGPQLSDRCEAIAKGLAEVGIRANSDIAYSLLNLSTELNSKGDVLNCLGERKFAMAAATLPLSLKGITESTQISPEDAVNAYPGPPQPEYTRIARRMRDLVLYLPKFPEGKETLEPLFSSQLTLTNASSNDQLDSLSNKSMSFDMAATELTAKGFVRYGCYEATRPSTGSDVDKATALFLMFSAAKVDRTVCLSKSYMIRPFFNEELKIFKLDISNDESWIRAVVANRPEPFTCGDGHLTIDKSC